MNRQIISWKGFSQLLHGCDYNPDQWLNYPEVLEEDIQLMKKANINCVSLGIFAWAALEPKEGQYHFEWLETIIQNLYENGIYTILATPTGAMPPWLTEQYQEVLQVDEYGNRNFPGNRHNFCPTSPIMRTKTRQINERLSKEFGEHPGVIAWHISNEYGGNGRDASCHCNYCQSAFRDWLKEKYETLRNINEAWWTGFWSHTYSSWEQIGSTSKRGEHLLHGQNLEWKRFVSHQLLDFCKVEIHAVRTYSKLPTTTNMMGFYKPLDYFKWAKELDIISWDSYPDWHSGENEIKEAVHAAAAHSLMRSLKKAPFLIMESTPSMVNWKPHNTLKRPGMHQLSALQAIAHGSQSVQYFQWRKSRGGCEKFHGAVVDHKNGEHTRVFREVEEVGKSLHNVSDQLYTTCNQPKIALIFDWENWWALEDAYAVENGLKYQDIFLSYYQPLWEKGMEADIIDMDGELSKYDLIIAPLNYMYRGDYTERVKEFVKNGGTYVTTYWSGEVDDTDLCFLEEHPLQDVLGIQTEEIDAPNGYCHNQVEFAGNYYDVQGLCGLVHSNGAKILGTYQNDFYKGYPALLENKYGKGYAYYIASENEPVFIQDVYDNILDNVGISCDFKGVFPKGVTVSCRKSMTDLSEKRQERFWFLQNFNRECVTVNLKEIYRNIETNQVLEGNIKLDSFECLILSAEANMSTKLGREV